MNSTSKRKRNNCFKSCKKRDEYEWKLKEPGQAGFDGVIRWRKRIFWIVQALKLSCGIFSMGWRLFSDMTWKEIKWYQIRMLQSLWLKKDLLRIPLTGRCGRMHEYVGKFWQLNGSYAKRRELRCWLSSKEGDWPRPFPCGPGHPSRWDSGNAC